MTLTPTESLLSGAKIIDEVLAPSGFVFEYRENGFSSGGHFAWGEFVRGDRRLELHFRHNLGQVTYHAAGNKATHESYMRELKIWGKHHFPGFSSEPLQAFRDLSHDLSFARDFTSGTAHVLLAAARNDAIAQAAHAEMYSEGYISDTRNIEKLRELFREKRYAEIVAIGDDLKSPHLMSDSQLRLVQLARQRAGHQ